MIRFLQKEGRVQKWLLGGFLFIVSLSMVVYLIPQGTGNDVNQPNTLATVGDQKVTMNDVQLAAAQFSRSRGQQFPSALMPMLVDQLITQQAEIFEAHRIGLTVSDAELRDSMRHNYPGLFPDGKFVGQDKYRDLLSQNGISIDRFEQQERGQLLTEKLLTLVTSPVSATPAEIQKDFENQNTKVKLEYAVVTPESVSKEIKPNDAELRAYYNSHMGEFKDSIPEKRQAKYVYIDLTKLTNETQVSREEVNSYYNQHKEDFRRPEEVKASHILIKVKADNAAAGTEGLPEPEAKKKAEDLLAKVKAGANFVDVAKKESQDAASAINGGSLGWFQRGAMVPEFEKVAFSLQPGQISGLVKTQFGYHIIKVDDKHTAGIPPVEQVKDQIETVIKQQKAQQQAQKVADAVYNQARGGGNLDNAAAKENLQVITSGWFARTDSLPGIGSSPEFMDAAFSAKKDSPAQEVGTQQGYVIFQLTGVKPPSTPSFEEARAQIEKEFQQERSQQLIQQKTQELADRAHALHDLKKAAKEVGAEIKTTDFLGQNGQAPDLGNLSGPAGVAFSLKQGEISGPLNVGRGGAVLMVTDRQEPQMSGLAKSQDQIRDQILQRKRSEAERIYLASLTKRLEQEGKIKKNQQQIDALARRGEGL